LGNSNKNIVYTYSVETQLFFKYVNAQLVDSVDMEPMDRKGQIHSNEAANIVSFRKLSF
jgi:hypothetical protein